MIKEILTYSDNDDCCKTSYTLTNQQRKRKRIIHNQTLKRCSVCLDSSLYTDSQLLECVKCKGPYHSLCIPGSNNERECEKCKNLTKVKKHSETIK